MCYPAAVRYSKALYVTHGALGVLLDFDRYLLKTWTNAVVFILFH